MWIDGRELFVDLVMLEIQEYEVILGMDWLSKYNTTIDCGTKRVIFQPSEDDQFVFIGTPPKNQYTYHLCFEGKKIIGQ